MSFQVVIFLNSVADQTDNFGALQKEDGFIKIPNSRNTLVIDNMCIIFLVNATTASLNY